MPKNKKRKAKKANKTVSKRDKNLIGAWAFLIGLILAIILGIFNTSLIQGTASSIIIVILFVLGVIIGLLNITDKEAMPFLLAGAVLVIVSAFGSAILATIPVLSRVLDSIMILFVPATIIVALRAVFSMGRK
jgi:predicted membrane channel-forming protein YqfA (hemolysin III family)